MNDSREQVATVLAKTLGLVWGGYPTERCYNAAEALIKAFPLLASGLVSEPPHEDVDEAWNARSEEISDISIAARALRASSWPGEMAEEMEQRSRRLDALVDRLRVAALRVPDPPAPLRLLDEMVSRGHHFEVRWVPGNGCGCSDPEYCERHGNRREPTFIVAFAMKEPGRWRSTEKFADLREALIDGLRLHDEEHGAPAGSVSLPPNKDGE